MRGFHPHSDAVGPIRDIGAAIIGPVEKSDGGRIAASRKNLSVERRQGGADSRGRGIGHLGQRGGGGGKALEGEAQEAPARLVALTV